MKYIVDIINNYSDNDLTILEKKINPEKIQNISKIKNPNYKKRKIISENLLMNGLKDFYNIDYNSLTFTTNKYKKPYIKNKNIYFNISHSYDYCVCTLSTKEIGIDIEKIRNTHINTLNKFTTKNERKYILEIPEKQNERLFEIFTLKEAYFKMKGKDLSNIKNIEFKIDKENITCNDRNVELKLIKIIPNYIIAICESK